ncbi:MAG: carboxypeptidase regulatory-like domain-containing protein [Desulfobacteraceae bacterium]|nr:carboxypeptidase regulatory-like domain-containing protein [Desulfobacteraceae bacterium]
MKTVRIIIPWLIVCFACRFVEATSYQLIGEHFADVGNRWEYQIHITEYPEQGSVNWWGTGVREIVRHENIEGYDTALFQVTMQVPQIGTEWVKYNYSQTSEYVLEVRYEDEYIIHLVRNNNPLELIPLWVSDSDNNRHIGYGEYHGTLKDPYYTWDGYQDSYITFLGTETIVVPAGTFDCTVVLLRQEFHEFAGIWGYGEMTTWFNLEVGIIKTDEYAWIWDPVEGRASTARLTTELTSFSLVNHDPQLSGGLVSPASGDTNTDFYWYVDYYDEDGDSPVTKDVYVDGTVHTMTLDSGSASDGTYRYSQKLGEGPHDYYFYFEDGYGGSDRLPSSGTSSGPSVTAASFAVSGRVTDKYTSLPLDNIRVFCWHDDEDFWTETRTDINGMYEITNLPPGEVEIRAEPDTYYACIGVEFELTADVNGVDFALPPEAILSGKVSDADTAEPVAGVEVTYSSDRYAVWKNGYTDADGTFTLTNLPPGIGEIKARPQVETGYAWSLPWGSNWVCLAEGEHRSNRIIALQKGALVSGYIKDANGDPASGVEYEYGGRMSEGWDEADVNGHYQINLPPGTYVISMDEDDLCSLLLKVTITDISQPVDVNDMIVYSEETGGQISGAVNNPGGHGKTGEFIVIVFEAGTEIDANSWYTVWPIGEAELTQAGPFTIGALPPDANYDVALCVISETFDEIESFSVQDFVLNVPVGTSGINLDYNSEGSTVTGSVENTDSQAVMGATVLLNDSATGNFAGFADTDPNGEYVIYNVPAGEYTATAVHSKYLNASTMVQVVDGVAADVSTIVMPFAGEKESANLNGDGIVNMLDVAVFTNQWLQSGSLEADFNQDSNVNFSDWARLAENWLWEPIWYHD